MKLNGPYPLPNVAWRKNRNAFAALLARAVEEIDFRQPFDRRPPGAPQVHNLVVQSMYKFRNTTVSVCLVYSSTSSIWTRIRKAWE